MTDDSNEKHLECARSPEYHGKGWKQRGHEETCYLYTFAFRGEVIDASPGSSCVIPSFCEGHSSRIPYRRPRLASCVSSSPRELLRYLTNMETVCTVCDLTYKTQEVGIRGCKARDATKESPVNSIYDIATLNDDIHSPSRNERRKSMHAAPSQYREIRYTASGAHVQEKCRMRQVFEAS